MSLEAMGNTAASLSYYLRLQEVTANNLANANTDAFKAIRLAAHAVGGADHPVAVEQSDLRQGALHDTGRSFDLGLEGPGFFVVRTEQGERLIRGGPLTLDPTGRLTDLHGAPLLSQDGPVVVLGESLEVLEDGTVLVDGALAGRLRMEDVADPSLLRREGYGRFDPGGPTRPVPEDTTRVRQGRLEEANIDPIPAMVDLVTIQRAYAANIDALRAMDGVMGIVTGQVGRV
jgi:flagellar basal body rod protein FlgG